MSISETDRGIGQRIRGRAVAAALAALIAFAAPAGAQTSSGGDGAAVTAAINAGGGRLGRIAAIPEVLNAADVAVYRKIFSLQQRGQWAQADRERAKLGDNLLEGYVLAQRYLHPWYRSKYAELKAWMAAYADHPAAADIHKLAKARMGKPDDGLKPPARRPVAQVNMIGDSGPAGWETATFDSGQHLKGAERVRLRNLKTRFRTLVRQEKYAAAIDLMNGAEFQRLAEKIDVDDLRTNLAARYFATGDVANALRWAVPAADRSGEALPQAHWIAGLATWRSGKSAESRRHFEAVANTRGSPWMISAGAYWAARANLVAKRPQVVNHWLEIAASHQRTFYGLLARRALGLPISFGWEAAPFTDVDAAILLRVPSARRALALMQLDREAEAETELQRLSGEATPALSRSLLSFAHAADMPDLAVLMGGIVARRDGRYHDSAAYPVPGWVPQGGWVVDRALVLAFARQESAFDPRAKSRAGAAGLMQLMPATAREVAGTAVSQEKLFDPSYNLALGQAYIKQLLAHPAISGNLFLLAAAYNSGPGNLERWLGKIDYQDDPLLFIEAIPTRETRGFVVKVMTNLWIYRARLGQPMASIDAVVAGDWPLYSELDKRVPRPKPIRKPAGTSG